MYNEHASDPRIIRTRQRLWNAMVELTLQKGYDRVTIREIVAVANVGYATFFRHYQDKDALIQDILTRSIQELQTITQQHDANMSARDLGEVVFAYVAANESVCRVLVDQRSPAKLRRRVIDTVIQLISLRQPLPARAGVPTAIMMHHIAVSSLHLIAWWLDEGMPYAPIPMGSIFAALIVEPFQESLTQSSPLDAS